MLRVDHTPPDSFEGATWYVIVCDVKCERLAPARPQAQGVPAITTRNTADDRIKSAAMRQAVRQDKSKPRVQAFKGWCERQLLQVPGKGDLAKAIRYGLNRWEAFALFLEDGRVAIDNNPAERAIRPVAVGRKNFLFVGSDAGGETLADAMTVIETAKLSGLDPEAYLRDLLARINDHKINRLDELLPWSWKPAGVLQEQAA